MSFELYYVTGNAGKFEEVERFLSTYAPEIKLLQADVDLQEQQTDDQLAIALHKAQQAWDLLGKPLLVDDAGVYFDKYHKFPGTMTKFLYQGIGFDGIFKLVEHGDRARFFLYLIYVDGPTSFHTFEGECLGQVVKPAVFNAHPRLPFDDIFLPDGSDKTYVEMRHDDNFDLFAYRLHAVKKFVQWLHKKSP
ncbi:hypothetical protein K2X40_01865 [Candidatus Babeliales bacterium]|nr:hypothetical protein [Candidatus Babeliales bacterium]